MECAGRNMHNHCAAIYINVEQCDDTHLNEKTMSIISRDAAAEARNDVSLISALGQKISYFDCATGRTDKTERECAKCEAPSQSLEDTGRSCSERYELVVGRSKFPLPSIQHFYSSTQYSFWHEARDGRLLLHSGERGSSERNQQFLCRW